MKPLDQLKRLLAYSLIASVVVGAAFGIAAVLRNEWTWFELRVLLTTVVLAAASLCGLACEFARAPRGLNLIPYAGLALTLLAAVLLLILLWSDISNDFGEGLAKAAWTTSVFAVATAHFSLLSVARLSRRFQWILAVAFFIIYALASLLTAVVLLEFQGPEESLLRPIAVLSILAVAISLVIPLLHRISQTDPSFAQLSPQEEQNAAALDAEIEKLERRLSQLKRFRSKLDHKAGSHQRLTATSHMS